MYDVLIILAAIANIGTFLFQLKQEYLQSKRTVKEKKERTGGNQSL